MLSILMLSACGYHLRGAYTLPSSMKSIYLQGGSPQLREQLNKVMETSSGKLVGTPDKADTIIKIYRDNVERRVVSLSERGRSNQIELDGRIEYEIKDNKKGVIVAREPINFNREYFNDQQDIIAKDNEESVIRDEMYQQAVKTMINRSRIALEGKTN
jgi:LPS-assembly lipoprotein